jgi:hypothetical protein
VTVVCPYCFSGEECGYRKKGGRETCKIAGRNGWEVKRMKVRKTEYYDDFWEIIRENLG